MKKFGKLLLAGTLVLGGTTVASQIVAPIETQAASDVFHDDWGFYNTSLLFQFGTKMPAEMENQVRGAVMTTVTGSH
ncbi:TPA: DUF5065 family protein [Bacillus pseudomycoides]|nr:DUF5065 family protein [Bacillus pseudomycoides]